jgi:chromosome segregation ATPase
MIDTTNTPRTTEAERKISSEPIELFTMFCRAIEFAAGLESELADITRENERLATANSQLENEIPALRHELAEARKELAEAQQPVSLAEAASRPEGSISCIHQYDARAVCVQLESLRFERDATLARAEKIQEDIEECLMSVCLGALPTTDTCEAVQRIQQAAGEARAELASLREQLEAAKAAAKDVTDYIPNADEETLLEWTNNRFYMLRVPAKNLIALRAAIDQAQANEP